MMSQHGAGGWGVPFASGGAGTCYQMPARDILLDLLARHAYNFDPSEPYELASGVKSAEYIDCKSALSLPQALSAAAALIHAELLPSVTAIGGLTMGADPLAIATSLHSGTQPHSVRWFTVRKQPKAHGLMLHIEGGLPPTTEAAIVDDVVTAGGSTLEAISRCLVANFTVRQVIVLVDRQQGGLDRIRKEVPPTVPVTAIFTKAEIHERWERQKALAASGLTLVRP